MFPNRLARSTTCLRSSASSCYLDTQYGYTCFPHARQVVRLEVHKGPWPPRGSRGRWPWLWWPGCTSTTYIRCCPFLLCWLFFSRVSCNGSPHVVFSRCGYHVPALACRARGVPSGPRHVQSFNGRRARAQRWKPNGPSPRRGGTDGESKRSAASERTPLSSTTRAPDAAGQEAGVRWALSRRTGPYSRDSRRRNRGTPPRDKGAPTPERDGHQPKDWLFRYPARYFCTTSGTSSCRRSLFACCLSEVDVTGTSWTC